MDDHKEFFNLNSWISDGHNGKRPANDADSTDERYEKLLNAFAFWKHMPAWRIKSQTFSERVERAEMLKLVKAFEARRDIII